ncbi:MAG: hypothetical protein HDT43_03295 [Ruminococcaceae bacterium]|nr:hypothetical protein [Oscillospiraceae bacterium]
MGNKYFGAALFESGERVRGLRPWNTPYKNEGVVWKNVFCSGVLTYLIVS